MSRLETFANSADVTRLRSTTLRIYWSLLEVDQNAFTAWSSRLIAGWGWRKLAIVPDAIADFLPGVGKKLDWYVLHCKA